MRTTTADVRTLIAMVDRNEIRLPEIQRGYVWKPPKIAGLVDSLYRGYPTGSLLLWETAESVVERNAAVDGPIEKPLSKPQYLIDGQQRLTSLHRVFKGHDEARIVFNIETERFQRESAATAKDRHWIRVHDILGGSKDIFSLIDQLVIDLPTIDKSDMHRKLERLMKVGDYRYYIEILDDLPYREVADIFVRVNSRGVTLRSVDLALATLSARWHGVIAELQQEAKRWADVGYRAISVAFLARAIAGAVSDTGSFRVFAVEPVENLKAGWQEVRRGVEHLVQLLRNNAHIRTSELLPSDNALLPLVAYLGRRPDVALDSAEADALLYWLFATFIQSRYSSAVETVYAQDLTAIRQPDAIEALFRNLQLFGKRVKVSEDSLQGKTERSPYFLFSYLVAERAGARDWWFGVDLCTDGAGHFKLEYHHIHPRATLKASYTKTEINDLANFAFISSKANRKISDRSPMDYFPEIEAAQLEAHFVPLDEAVRTSDAYPSFIRRRRKLLADAMTNYLDSFAPAFLSGEAEAEYPAAGESLAFEAYGGSKLDPEAILVVTARRDGDEWRTQVALGDLDTFFVEITDGNPAELQIGGETVSVPAGAESVELPFGPFVVHGTLEEWRSVLEREYAEIQSLDLRPSISAAEAWGGDREHFPVVDSQ